MAKNIIKNTPISAVVVISGANANETIDISSDLLQGMQDTDGLTPEVNIAGIWWSIPANSGAIIRNAVTLWSLSLSDRFRFDGWSDTRLNTFDINVTLGAGGGTIVLDLRKTFGYGDTQHRNDAGWEGTTTTTEAPTTTTTV